eukprot:GILK01012034.1.p1 GENE.GILK01012034.1~~GILK01012034.1.p1  ORF type:complete len:450 (-),score=70.01 GILK01012034.1:218-1513(-)
MDDIKQKVWSVFKKDKSKKDKSRHDQQHSASSMSSVIGEIKSIRRGEGESDPTSAKIVQDICKQRPTKERAAVHIQRIFRGYRARRVLWELSLRLDIATFKDRVRRVVFFSTVVPETCLQYLDWLRAGLAKPSKLNDRRLPVKTVNDLGANNQSFTKFLHDIGFAPEIRRRKHMSSKQWVMVELPPFVEASDTGVRALEHLIVTLKIELENALKTLKNGGWPQGWGEDDAPGGYFPRHSLSNMVLATPMDPVLRDWAFRALQRGTSSSSNSSPVTTTVSSPAQDAPTNKKAHTRRRQSEPVKETKRFSGKSKVQVKTNVTVQNVVSSSESESEQRGEPGSKSTRSHGLSDLYSDDSSMNLQSMVRTHLERHLARCPKSLLEKKEKALSDELVFLSEEYANVVRIRGHDSKEAHSIEQLLSSLQNTSLTKTI